MKLIIKDRGMGKTTQLIKESCEKHIPILCTNAKIIKEKANDLDVKIPEPLDLKNLDKLRTMDKVLIDDIDSVLIYLINCGIESATISPSDLDVQFESKWKKY